MQSPSGEKTQCIFSETEGVTQTLEVAEPFEDGYVEACGVSQR